MGSAHRPSSHAAAGAAGSPGPYAAAVSSSCPPSSITGGKSIASEPDLSPGIDWLAFTAPAACREQIVAELVARVGPGEPAPGVNFYRESMRWDCGIRVAWTQDRPECWVQIPSQGLAFFPSELELLEWAARRGARCTRIDLRLDDFTFALSLGDVEAAAEAGNVVGFRKHRVIRERDMMAGSVSGEMSTFGQRGKNGSGKYVRIYNKALESNGERPCIRVEVQAEQKVARLFLELLQAEATQQALSRRIAFLVVGSIDFRERRPEAHGHVNLMPRLSWWEQVVERVGGLLKVRVQRSSSSLQKMMQWVDQALGRSLGVAFQCIQDSGHDAEAVALAFVRSWRIRGKGHRPSARAAGIDLAALLPKLAGVGGGGSW